MSVAIETRALTKRFGGLVALDAVDLKAAAGETLGIIGVNGAGKTTLMNCICGLYRPDSGDVFKNSRATDNSCSDGARPSVNR